MRVLFLILLVILSGGILRAQEVVVDAGAATTLTPDGPAASYVWSKNGESTGRTSSTYSWTPRRNDTGVHWFKVDMTLSNGSKAEQHWRVRVRLPVPTSSLAYYVATDGANDNAGGIDDPFATLEKARDTIRALPRPLPAGGVTVFVRGGTYRRTSTFNLTAADSGTEAAPISYTAYGTESPVFTTARVVPAGSFTALDPAMTGRLASGVSAASIKQLDLNVHTFTYDGPFPTRFNQSRIYNPYLTSQDGGLFEVYGNGVRLPLSRYPNDNLADRFATPNLKMDGVTQKYATTLNGVAIGGQFKYKTADETRISRWQTAAAEGGLWIQGYFRVPWEEYGMKVKAIDTTANTITLAQGASMSLGLGNKYYGYEGSKTEPYWALNLLEEIDQAGEWSVDFVRKRLYLWPSVAINDVNFEISDFGSPVMKFSDASDVIIQGIEFRRSLGQGIVVSGGENVTVLGCKFRQLGSYAVDLENGYAHGVVSCDISDMAAGGIYVRGGDGTTTPRTRCDHFVVNNDIQDIAKVVKIYAAGVDAGFGGQAGNGGGGGYKPCVGARVASNRIAYTHHTGILHGSLEKTIEYNVIDNFCRTNGDMGGIYCFTGLGGDDTIRFNQMTNKSYAWETYFPGHSIGGSGIQADLSCDGSRMFGNIIETIRSGFSVNVGDGAGIFNNLIVNNQKSATSIGGTPVIFRTNVAALGLTTFGGTATGTNKTYTSDPGILSRSGNDYRLKTTSTVYKDLSLFDEIPVEMIGLCKDEIRTNPPGLKPVIDNPGGATSITQTSATLNGRLDFPFINPDTTVRVYWGTTDGGTSSGNWQNNASLGIRTRGALAHALSGLTPKTKYYFRYSASNPAGGSWAATTRSFTTGSPLSYKANNTTDLSSTGSWTNGAVPVGGMAVWNSTVTAANAVTIGTGVSLLGIQITNPGGNVSIAPGTSGTLGLGSGGLDLPASDRTLLISAPVVLNSDQTWTTGNAGAAGSTQITASGNISGGGELRVDATAGRGIALTGTNSFSGGLVLESGGRVLTGTTAATATTNAFGTGPLTILGGVIGSTGGFALNTGIAHPLITVNNDFTLSPAGRMMIGGTWDLGGATRTVACTRGTNSGSALQSGGNTSWGIGTVGTRAAVVSNGTLRVARDSSLGSAFVSFRLHNAPEFTDNAGLAIGSGVISVLAGALAQADPGKLPDLTVEAGGYFSLSEDGTPADASIASLSGDGDLGNYTRSASHSTATLTIDGGQRLDTFTFSGRLVDNNPALSSLATLGKLNLVKTGSTTQVLAGANTYTGTTSVMGGTLEITGSLASPSNLTVAAAARLSGQGSIASPAGIEGALEPTGALTFSTSLSFSATSGLTWVLPADNGTGHPSVAADTAVIAAGSVLHVKSSETAGSTDFTAPVWSAPRVFTLLTAAAITGNFTLGSVSADSAGNSHEPIGFFVVENTGSAIQLRWFPLGSADGWRFKHFGTTSNTGDAADSADPDGDGFTNQQERAGDTDPNDPADYPGATWIQTSGPATQFWSTAANWSGGQLPVSQANARLDFFTGMELTDASVTSRNDLPGDFQLSRLVLTGDKPGGTTGFQITGNPLRFVRNGQIAPRMDLETTGAGVTATLAMPITLDAPVTVHRLGDAAFVLAGAMDGPGSLDFQGEAGSIRLTGDNTYSGGTVVSSGTLIVGNDGPTGSLGTGPVAMDGQLRVDRAGALAIPGIVSGAGGISIYNPSAADIVTLSGDNRFLGSVVVGGGGLRVQHSNALGTTAKGIYVQTSATGSLRLDGSGGNLTLPVALTLHLSNPNGVLVNEAGDNRINGAVTLSNFSGNARFVSMAGMLTLAGTITPGASGRVLELSGAGNGRISGTLATGAGGTTLAGLTKSDAGTWTLAGNANACSGTTSVIGGTLDVTGNLTCGSGLSVASDGTFAGNATFSAASTVNGTLMPSLATFNGPLTFSGGSTLAWKTTGNADGLSGRANAGTVAVTAGAKVALVFNAPGSVANFQHLYWRTARTWTLLASSNNEISGTFMLGTISTDSAGQNASAFGTFSLQQSASAVVISWTPIPGLPSIWDPVVTRVSPAVSPVATIDVDHLLRVAASATGGGSMYWTWSRTSGPGAVTFNDASASDTFASFGASGRYVLRATAANSVGTGFTEFTVDVAPAASFSLREGVNGYSHQGSFVRADSESWNSGARDMVVVGKTSAAARAMFSFGVSSIPRTWPVAAVTLDLWTHPSTAGSGTIGNLHLRRLTRSITEGTGDGSSSTNGSGTGVDWLKFNGYNSWTTPGGDFESSALTTLAGFNATTTGVQRTFPSTASFVTALNTAMTAGSAFNLVVLAPSTESDTTTNVYTRFASDDHPTESLRPRLTVHFAHSFTPSVNAGPAPSPATGVPAALGGSATNASTTTWRQLSGPGTVTFANPAVPVTTAVFPLTGNYLLILAAANAQGESGRPLAVIIPPNIQAWRQSHFGISTDSGIAADSADPDHDGHTNLLEFATGNLPNTPDGAIGTLGNVGALLEFTYPRGHAAVADGCEFHVEWSTTLGNDWSEAGVSQAPVPGTDNGTSVRWKASVTSLPANKNFLRLRITKP